MKLTKSKLLRLIKEETEAALAEENGGPIVAKSEADMTKKRKEAGQGWIDEMEALLLDIWRRGGRVGVETVVEFYNRLPDEGKPYLIDNLKMYAEEFPEKRVYEIYLRALDAPMEEAVYHRDEEEPVDLNAMDPNEAFGFAWSKAIEILQGAGHEEAACLLSAAAGDDPDDERVGDQPPEEVELDMALNERKDVEIGDIVKHEEYGQGRLVALRSGKGGDRRAVVKWDKKGENRETIVDALTVVKKGKKK